MKNKVGILKALLYFLSIMLFSLNTYFAIHYRFLGNDKIKYIYFGVNLIIIVAIAILLYFRKLKKTTFVIIILYNLLSLFLFYNIVKAVDFIETLNNNGLTSEYTMSVAVRSNSEINNIEDLVNQKIQAPMDMDKENINLLLTDIKKKKKIDLKTVNGPSYTSDLDSLLRGDTKAIVVNSAYEDLIRTAYPEYDKQVKKIYEYKVIKDNSDLLFNRNKKLGDSFNIYVSGIDIYGPITTVSRSDVNIIATVNTKTKKILLTTVPRDSYVKIADGGKDQYDKLTHAGVYGINSSVHTLENLLDIKIDYYARVNFSRFMNIVDYVGGIEVNNDKAFTSYHGKYDFPVGNVELDSKKALGFVRERYSFEHGDQDRAKNQQKVLTELIRKMTKIKSLSNYEEIIYEIINSTQTNMPLDVMMNFVNKNFDSNTDFDIKDSRFEGVFVNGLPSYAMPDRKLNMFKLSEDSVIEAQKKIKDVLNGK